MADLGRQPDAAERHLISTIADLAIQREALSSAQMRGEPVDSMVSLKIAGLITRTIAALRGTKGGKPAPRPGRRSPITWSASGLRRPPMRLPVTPHEHTGHLDRRSPDRS